MKWRLFEGLEWQISNLGRSGVVLGLLTWGDPLWLPWSKLEPLSLKFHVTSSPSPHTKLLEGYPQIGSCVRREYIYLLLLMTENFSCEPCQNFRAKKVGPFNRLLKSFLPLSDRGIIKYCTRDTWDQIRGIRTGFLKFKSYFLKQHLLPQGIFSVSGKSC